MGPFRKYVVLSGLMLINSVVALNTFYGNLSTYIYSIHYFYHKSDSGFDIDPSVMLPAYLVSKATGSFAADFVQRKIGLTYSTGVGILIYLFSISITYFTITHSMWATTLTLMVGGGLGNSMVSVANYIHVANWFPSKVGLASAISASSTAAGGVLLNTVTTSFINPDNLSADVEKDSMIFFSQRAIIDRIPWAFLVIAAVSGFLMVIGFLLIPKHPPEMTSLHDGTTLSSSKSSGKRTQLHQSSKSQLYTMENGLHPNEEIDSLSSSKSSTSSPNAIDNTSAITALDGMDTSSDTYSNVVDEEKCLTPLQVIKTETYYILISVTIAIALGVVVSMNYYKLFGQLWIKDDHFMALIGSSASLVSNIFLIGCGIILDRFGHKSTLVAHLSLSSFFFCLWYFTAQVNRWLYLVWTVVTYGVHNNVNILFSLSTLVEFGRRHFAVNFGVMQIGLLTIYILSPTIITSIIHSYGWFWLFFTTGSVSFVSLVLVVLRFPSKGKTNGQ